MTSIVFLKNKKNGKVYAYVNEKVHDDITDTYVYRRKCIGHLDPVTGNVIPNRTKDISPSPKVLPCGHTLFLYGISEAIGLTDSLQIVFPDSWKKILTYSIFVLCEKKPMSTLPEWTESNYTDVDEDIDLSSVLHTMSRITDYDIDSFMKVWKKRIDFSDFTILSVSPISSYIDRVAMTYSEDIVFNSAVELELCFAGHVPFSYVRHSIGLHDLDEMFSVDNRFERYDVINPTRLVRPNLCNGTDLDTMIGTKTGFSMMMPFDGDLFARLMEENITRLFGHTNVSGDASSFTSTVRRRINGRYVYLHFYYSAELAENQTSAFLSMIERCKLELDHGHVVPPHEPLYQKYFLVGEDEDGIARIQLNSDAIMKRNDLAGYSIIVTDTISDADEAMLLFDINTHAEFVFDNLYNSVDRTKLKLYNLQNDQARLFIQFIALILRSAVNERFGRFSNDNAVTGILESLKHVYYVDMPGRKKKLGSKLTKEQKDLLSSVGVRF